MSTVAQLDAGCFATMPRWRGVVVVGWSELVEEEEEEEQGGCDDRAAGGVAVKVDDNDDDDDLVVTFMGFMGFI